MALTLVWCVNKYSGKILLLTSYVEMTCKTFPTKKKLMNFCQDFSQNICRLNEDFFLIFRSSYLEMLCKMGVLKDFSKFIWKHLCFSFWSTLIHACSCNFYGFFKNTFFTEHLRGTHSVAIYLFMFSVYPMTRCYN